MPSGVNISVGNFSLFCIPVSIKCSTIKTKLYLMLVTAIHQKYSDSSALVSTRVSAAADRPARRSGSAHAKYFVSHHMIIRLFLLLGLAAEYRSRRWMWSTVVRRPSEVYDTHRRTNDSAWDNSPSKDMVGAHQNLNGLRDLTTPLSGIVYHPRTCICSDQSIYQIWSV